MPLPALGPNSGHQQDGTQRAGGGPAGETSGAKGQPSPGSSRKEAGLKTLAPSSPQSLLHSARPESVPLTCRARQ